MTSKTQLRKLALASSGLNRDVATCFYGVRLPAERRTSGCCCTETRCVDPMRFG